MKSLELFSGAGGLATGLSLAGFDHVALVERNKHASATLRQNFEPDKIFYGDINDFDFLSLDSIDLVAGGPPCQPFSLGGKHRADQDKRDLFPQATKAIETLAPRAFIFENVKGLLRSSFADYFEYIRLRLTYPSAVCAVDSDWKQHLLELRSLKKYSGLTYDLHYALLNAADYGVPQQRERVFIVGLRSDLDLKWSFPRSTHSREQLLWDMNVTANYWKRHNLPRSSNEKVTRVTTSHLHPWKTIRDALQDVPDPRCAHGISDHVFRDGARSYPGHTGSPLDWVCKTIKAGDHGVPGGENMILLENGMVRYLTVFEAKKIQTFPEQYQIEGAWTEAMRQIGNAVPVKLAQVLGQQLRQTLEGSNSGVFKGLCQPMPLLQNNLFESLLPSSNLRYP
jgi:DNA (cytosine-5)-methyltransferase 1